MNLALGTIYSWSVFRIPLEQFFGWASIESGLPFTLFLAVFALTMPVAGRIMNVLGPRKTALSGGLLVGLGWALARFAEFTPQPLVFMLLAYGVIGGVGVGLVYGVPIAVSSKWIPERKGLATGITILGFGLSPLITAGLATFLIGAVGVLDTFLYLGIVFAVLLVALSIPLKFPPANMQPSLAVTSAKPVTYADRTSKEMVGTATFAGLWLTYALGTTGGFTAISLAAKYACEVCGLSVAAAAGATSFFAVFNGLGRPVFGYLCDRINPRKVAILSFGIIAVAASILTGSTALPAFLIAFSLLWFSFGGWLAIAPSATSTYFGLRSFASNYGLVFTAYGAGAIVGPMVASYIRSVTNSYSPAFATTIILALIGLIVAYLTYRPPKAP